MDKTHAEKARHKENTAKEAVHMYRNGWCRATRMPHKKMRQQWPFRSGLEIKLVHGPKPTLKEECPEG